MFVRILTLFGALQYRSARLDRCRFDSTYTFAVTVFESPRYWHKTCIVNFSLFNAAFMSASKITIEGKEGEKEANIPTYL